MPYYSPLYNIEHFFDNFRLQIDQSSEFFCKRSLPNLIPDQETIDTPSQIASLILEPNVSTALKLECYSYPDPTADMTPISLLSRSDSELFE